MFKGEVKITVDGKERALKFGTLSFGLFCEAENMKLSDLEDRIQNPHPFTQINLIHTAAVAYCRVYKIPIDFDRDDVSVWIDEIGSNQLALLMIQALERPLKKNVTTEEEAGKLASA